MTIFYHYEAPLHDIYYFIQISERNKSEIETYTPHNGTRKTDCISGVERYRRGGIYGVERGVEGLLQGRG